MPVVLALAATSDGTQFTATYGPTSGGSPYDPVDAGGTAPRVRLYATPDRIGSAVLDVTATRTAFGEYAWGGTLPPGVYYAVVTWSPFAGQPDVQDADDVYTVPAYDGSFDSTLDILTLAEGYAALPGVVAGSRDDDVARYITAASAALDDLCGAIVIRTVAETHTAGGTTLFPHHPVDSVTNLALDGTALDATTGYQVDGAATPYPSVALGSYGGGYSTSGFPARYTLTYRAGRFASTAVVSPRFKQACAFLVRHWWRPEEGGGGEVYGAGLTATGVPSFGIPNVVKDMLSGELRLPGIA